jgi:hypothetical protein
MDWKILHEGRWVGRITLEANDEWLATCPGVEGRFATLVEANDAVRAALPDCRIVSGIRISPVHK